MSINTTTTTDSESTKAVNEHTNLPPELWLIIFRLATSSPITYPTSPSDAEATTSYYEPFQPCHHETTIALSDAAVRDRCAITLVCRQWHALAGYMRYEDIRIGHGIAVLQAALSEPAPGTNTNTDTDTTSSSPSSSSPPSRYRVRRAVLPYTHTATPTYHAPPALALLALLPHLEVLVRPPLSPPLSSPPGPPPPPSHRRTLIPIATTRTTTHSLPITPPRFEFPTAAPALPALRRLEWAFEETGAAVRAGGINSLTDMLKAVAPTLSELVLTGPMPFATLRHDHVTLPALRTLRFRAGACGCVYLNIQTSYWTMPALENVVVEGGGLAFDPLWEKVGGLVRVVELELGEGAKGMSMVDVRLIVNACPELEELNLRIGCDDLNCWSPMDYVHDTLQRLGICVGVDVDVNVDYSNSQDQEWSVKTWIALAEFVGDWMSCPALRQVVLYVRDVQVVERNPQFHLFHGELASGGRELLLRSVCF